MMLFSMQIKDYEKKKISFWRATARFFASCPSPDRNETKEG